MKCPTCKRERQYCRCIDTALDPFTLSPANVFDSSPPSDPSPSYEGGGGEFGGGGASSSFDSGSSDSGGGDSGGGGD